MKKKILLLLVFSLIFSMSVNVFAEAEKKEAEVVAEAEEVVEEVAEKAEEVEEKAEEAEEKVEEKAEEAEEKVEEKAEEAEEKVEEVEEKVAVTSGEKVKFNGKDIHINAYLIDRANYVKIRDIAGLLKDTKAKFLVEYDQEKDTVLATLGENHDEDFPEEKFEEKLEKTGIPSYQAVVTKDGKPVELKGYLIEGNNYFKLRDLGKAFNFGVAYDYNTGTVLLDSENPDLEDVMEEGYFTPPVNKIETEAGEEEVSFLIYGFESCPFCVKLKEFLDENGIEYLMRDITGDEGKKNEVMEKFYSTLEEKLDRVYYPTTIISLEKDGETTSKVVVGFTAELYENILAEIKANKFFE